MTEKFIPRVVEFEPRAREVNPELVAAIENMLELAKEGVMVGLAATWMKNDNHVFYAKGGVFSMGVIGSLQIMSHEIERTISNMP